MKSKQVLDVQQMQHLQELGVKLKETMMYWTNLHKEKQDWFMTGNPVGRLYADECLPAYTLQDVLDALPGNISYNEKYYYLTVDLDAKNIYYGTTFGFDLLKGFIYKKKGCLIDSAYSMLCWCIENGYIKTEGGE